MEGERVMDSQHNEDVNTAIDVAFREPVEELQELPSREQICPTRPVSEEHRKRSRRFSAELSVELNCFTEEKGSTPVAPESKAVNTKRLIEHYNRLSTVDKSTSPALPLYEYCILVGYDILQNKPYVKSRYPQHKKPHKMIEEFVYPDNGALVRNSNQEYCLIIFDYPLRLYGFCRRVLPESFEFCIPLSYCIITKYNEPKVFYKLLQCIESQHGNGRVPELLMEQFYNQKLPLAGERLTLTLPVSFEVRPMLREEAPLPITMTINRPKDLRLEKTELYDIFKCLGTDGLIHVFESLVLEKKVILFSEHLSLLTSCVQGLLLLLYPFQWNHLVVTVMPKHLQEMLEAPVPMLAGTMQPVPEELWEGGDMCYVNLDKHTVRLVRKEQFSILPSELKKPLVVALDSVKTFNFSSGLASILIDGAFVRFFVELFSTLDPETYEKSSFLERFENPETKLFLNCFLETLMFADFLEHWHSSKPSPAKKKSPVTVGSFDYTLFNSKIAEKSQTTYRPSSIFDEVVANSEHIGERKGKSFLSKMKCLVKKS